MTCPISKLAGTSGCSSDHQRASFHWRMQRVSALVLLALTPWFVLSLLFQISSDIENIRFWLSQPYTAFTMGLFVLISFWHGAQGMQVVIEDYVHTVCVRLALIKIFNIASLVFALLGVGAVIKLVLNS